MGEVRVRQPFFPPDDYGHIDPSLTAILRELPPAPEGHISPDQAEFLYSFVRLMKPRFVTETGFCVGHSAAVVMLAQRSAGLESRLMSVDSCQFAETGRGAEIIRSKFERFVFIQGDSKVVLQGAINDYLRANESMSLELGIVDGGHDEQTVSHDLSILLSFLKLGGFLWLDDFEKQIPNSGVNIAGRLFAKHWGSCVRFRTPGNRGIMLHQKAF